MNMTSYRQIKKFLIYGLIITSGIILVIFAFKFYSHYEIIFRIIEITSQLILVIIAWKALFTWKQEIHGKDQYKLAKDLLEYIKELRFLVYGKSSMHQIYLNDILIDKERFYKEQLFFIVKEKVYFDRSFFCLFDHINTRSDILLPKEIRIALESLAFSSAKKLTSDKSQYTYVQLRGINTDKVNDLDDVLYIFDKNKDATFEDYFKKWETLIIALQNNIYG